MAKKSDKSILEGAKAAVKKGWCQDRSQNLHQVCAWYAIVLNCPTRGGLKAQGDRADKVAKVFEEANKIGNLISWNDHPQRTKSEVVQAFNKAIAYAEKHDTI